MSFPSGLSFCASLGGTVLRGIFFSVVVVLELPPLLYKKNKRDNER